MIKVSRLSASKKNQNLSTIPKLLVKLTKTTFAVSGLRLKVTLAVRAKSSTWTGRTVRFMSTSSRSWSCLQKANAKG